MSRLPLLLCFVSVTAIAAASCSSGGDDGNPGTAGAAVGGMGGGAAGSSAGAPGSAGAGGAPSGAAGSGPAGAPGTGGTTGVAGSAAGGGGGNSGTSGSTGAAGAGRGGTPGAGGATGSAGGSGNAGRGGSATGNGGRGGSGTAGTGGGSGTTFTVTTPAFDNQAGCGPGTTASMCDTFPRDNTNYGTNLSPAMSWTGAPANTQSFAVVLQDLTNGYAHWVLWNIAGNVTSLPANIDRTTAMPAVPAGSQQCSIGSGATADGYYGPGACDHVYEFVVYALSVPSFSPSSATNQTMVRMQLQALGTSILGTASMRARSFMPECP
jgi:Raf kinase inhibitor-like YbhB/YbcL family protein